jgi:hypothetical protein
MKNWIDRAESALSGGPVGTDDVVMRGARPPLLDAEGFRAVAAPLLAAVVWSAAMLREVLAGTSIDPIALGLRVVALGLTVRVFLLGARLVERLRLWVNAQRYAIVLTPEGLFFRSPEVDVTIPREDVVGVVEPGRWQERSAGRRTSPVYVVTDPASGRTHVALPPVFDGGPGPLAERLMRWRGGWEEPEDAAPAAPHELASKIYDDAAAGRAAEGVAAIRHGREWIKKGPYAVVLIAVAAVEGMLRGGPRVWEALDPMIGGGFAVALLAVFARWVWMERRDIAPAKGLSLVLTPAELLIRTRSGMLRTAWRNLASVSVVTKRAWSVLEGAHDAKQLVLSRRNAGPIRYDEPYLGVPAEVAQLLIEAYRIGRLPARD